MKKIILVLLVALILGACSNKNLTLTDGDKIIISGVKETYTKEDFYNQMKITDFSTVLLQDMANKIAKLENIDLSNLDTEVEDGIKEMKEIYGDSYTQLEAYYGGEENIRKTLKSSLATEKLSKKYFDANYDKMKSTYAPKKAKMIYFSEKENAEKMLTDITSGLSFEDAAKANDYTQTISELVYTDKSELPIEVKEYLNKVSEPELADVIMSVTSSTDADGVLNTSNRYYVIEVTNTDIDSFKEDFYTSLVSLIKQDEIFSYYFSKYNVEIYDQAAYDFMASTYAGIK